MIAKDLLIQVPILTSNDPLDKAIAIFENNSVHVVPIVNNQELVGILTKTDIYHFLSRPGHYLSCPIDWIMTKNIHTANLNTSLKDLVFLLRENSIFSLPIIENNCYVGLVTIESILDYLIINCVQ